MIAIIRPLSAAAQDRLHEQLPQCVSLLTNEEFFQNCLLLATPPANGVVAVFDDYEQLRVGLVRKHFAVKERAGTPRADTFWLSFYFKGRGCIALETPHVSSDDQFEVCQAP